MLIIGGKDTKILQYYQIIIEKNVATSKFGRYGIFVIFTSLVGRNCLVAKI